MLRSSASRRASRVLHRHFSNKMPQKTHAAAGTQPAPPTGTESSSGFDPRILAGVGVAGAAAAYALWPTGGTAGAPPQPPTTLDLSEEDHHVGSGSGSDASHHHTDMPTFTDDSGDNDGGNEGMPQPPADSGTTTTTAASAVLPAAAIITDNDDDDQPTIVDSHAVLGVIEDILSKPADQMLREDEQRAAAKTPRDKERTSSHAATQQQQQHHFDKQETKEDDQDLQAAQMAMSSAISSTAGESVASDVGRLSSSSSFTHPPTPSSETTTSKKQDISASSSVAQTDDGAQKSTITAARLLAAASSRHPERVIDWETFPARLRQAEDDAATVAGLISEALQQARDKVNVAHATTTAALHEADDAKRAAVQQGERFRATLQAALEQAEAAHATHLREQAEALTAAHAEMTVRERAERQTKLDALRVQLGALERALQRRSDAAKSSHLAHRLAQGAFALQSALAQGVYPEKATAYLSNTCKDDPLVSAVVATLPRGSPHLPTPLQLAEELQHVERAASELALLPAGKGGMLSAAAAKLFASLKIRESAVGFGVEEEDNKSADSVGCFSVGHKLAKVRASAAAGKLLKAAEELENAVRGTAAAPAVNDWVNKARARAAAEQAAAVLEAHAAAAAAPLAAMA